MEKLFHQSSLPRAGSTLLQNILAQNPDIYATPTSGVLELVFAARGNYTDSPEFKAQDPELMKKGFLAFCLNPEPKIICMVRDLRDIFASMEKNYRKNPDKQDPILNWAQMSGTTVPKRIDIWAQNPPVGMAIERLGEVFRMGIDSKMLFVKFEDLCLYPEQQMNRIYAYLDIPFYKHDFDNIEQVTKEDDEVYGAFGDHTIRTKLEPVPSKAKTLLGKDVTDWIYNTYKWYFDQFGYKK
ncbi:MAG: sulfotransferase [Acidimicrobiia bacterium]|nr:sulfotransferase [Acidimicrobiia bacterium]